MKNHNRENENFLKKLNDLSAELIETALTFSEENIDIEQNPINWEKEIPNFPSEKLCGLIASNRYIKISDTMEELAMKELSNRRQNGEDFLFEETIEKMGEKFVPLDTKMSNVYELIGKAIKGLK